MSAEKSVFLNEQPERANAQQTINIAMSNFLSLRLPTKTIGGGRRQGEQTLMMIVLPRIAVSAADSQGDDVIAGKKIPEEGMTFRRMFDCRPCQ